MAAVFAEQEPNTMPWVDACHVSRDPARRWAMAREWNEPMSASRRFPITQMMDSEGEDTEDPAEAVVVVFGSEEFGWVTYELTGEPNVQPDA